MKKILISMAVACASTCGLSAGEYLVTMSVPSDLEGAMAYIVNYDTSENVDSVLVEDGVAEFRGNIDTPVAARIIVDGNRMSQFILEPGNITINPETRSVEGGKLNGEFLALQNQIGELADQLRATDSETEQEAIYARYEALTDSVMLANADNPVGYLVFMDKAYDFEPEQLEIFVEAHPAFKNYARVNKLIEFNKRKMATSEGSKFVDFEIEYDGVKHKLSDVVGKGDYVLVDFWASWCGPCIRQTAVLKDLYRDYKDEGLKILGVAVWDEPQNTLRAIEQHELPWESWLNGQNVPTDAYGISGIPCIILFGPDGTILSRDKQSEELKADVAKAMAEKKAMQERIRKVENVKNAVDTLKQKKTK